MSPFSWVTRGLPHKPALSAVLLCSSVLCPGCILCSHCGDPQLGMGKDFLAYWTNQKGSAASFRRIIDKTTTVPWPSSFKIELPWGTRDCFEKGAFCNVLNGVVLRSLVKREFCLMFSHWFGCPTARLFRWCKMHPFVYESSLKVGFIEGAAY